MNDKVSEKTEFIRILSIVLLTIGGSLFVTFFSLVENGVSINVIFISAVLLSLSAFAAIISIREDSTNLHFIFVLYVITLLLFLMSTIRFQTLSGTDILGEYRTAASTYAQGTWSLARSPTDRYFSAISISLTPAILKEFSGSSFLALFQYIYPMIGALLPLLLFLTVKEGFGNTKLAAIAAVLFAETNFNFTLLQSLVRQQIAEIFLLLVFFTLFKLESKKLSPKSKTALTVLLIIFMFGIVSSHYTIDYFAIPILAAIFIFGLSIPSLPKKFRSLFKIDKNLRTVVTPLFLGVFLVLSFVYISAVYYGNFFNDVYNEFRTVFSPITTTQYEVTFAFTGGPTAGILVTYWFDLAVVLSIIGFFYMALRMRKDAKNVSWMVAGLFLLCVTAIWVIPSVSNSGVYIDRIYTIGAIFFTTFVAYLLLEIGKRGHNRSAAIVLLLFLLLNLPINMYLPSNSTLLLYHSPDTVPPAAGILQGFPNLSNIAMSTYANQFISVNKTLVTDEIGEYSIFTAAASNAESPTPYPTTGDYLVLNYYNLHYDLWKTTELASENINTTDIMAQNAVVYNNGEAALVSMK